MDPKRFKHTALDDDTDFYDKPEKKTEKQKWQEMTKAQRRQYFIDYYLVKLIVVLACIGVVIWILVDIRPGNQIILNVAVLEDDIDDSVQKACEEELEQQFREEGMKGKVTIDDNYPAGNEISNTKITVYVQAHTLDVIIAPKEKFKTLAGQGFFQDLTEFLPGEKQTEYQSLLLSFAGPGDEEDLTDEEESSGGESTADEAGEETEAETGVMATFGKGPSLSYGLDLTGSEKYSYLRTAVSDPVLGVVVNAPHTQEILEFIDYLMQPVEETGETESE